MQNTNIPNLLLLSTLLPFIQKYIFLSPYSFLYCALFPHLTSFPFQYISSIWSINNTIPNFLSVAAIISIMCCFYSCCMLLCVVGAAVGHCYDYCSYFIFSSFSSSSSTTFPYLFVVFVVAIFNYIILL